MDYWIGDVDGRVVFGEGGTPPDGAREATREDWLAAIAATRLRSPPNLHDYAADKRWRVETGGITVGGVPVATDRESQSLITGAHAYVQINPGVTIKYKSGAGFIDLDAATVTAVATAVAAHVQACFAAEADLSAAITDGTITTTRQVDDWPWPETFAP